MTNSNLYVEIDTLNKYMKYKFIGNIKCTFANSFSNSNIFRRSSSEPSIEPSFLVTFFIRFLYASRSYKKKSISGFALLKLVSKTKK